VGSEINSILVAQYGELWGTVLNVKVNLWPPWKRGTTFTDRVFFTVKCASWSFFYPSLWNEWIPYTWPQKSPKMRFDLGTFQYLKQTFVAVSCFTSLIAVCVIKITLIIPIFEVPASFPTYDAVYAKRYHILRVSNVLVTPSLKHWPTAFVTTCFCYVASVGKYAARVLKYVW
jgi:hypothetical protein